MYNRYIPQPDGSYRRSRVQEPQPKRPPAPPQPVQEPCCDIPSIPEVPPCPPPAPHKRPQVGHHDSISGFLGRLLPDNFDTGDLIVVLLLLLLAGDCEEDSGTALLTLVLYLFM